MQADAPFPKALDVPKMFCSHLSGAQPYSPWLTGAEEEGGEAAHVCSAMIGGQEHTPPRTPTPTSTPTPTRGLHLFPELMVNTGLLL